METTFLKFFEILQEIVVFLFCRHGRLSSSLNFEALVNIPLDRSYKIAHFIIIIRLPPVLLPVFGLLERK